MKCQLKSDTAIRSQHIEEDTSCYILSVSLSPGQNAGYAGYAVSAWTAGLMGSGSARLMGPPSAHSLW